MRYLLLSVFLLFLPLVAAHTEDGKKAEIDATLSLANINKPAETLVIDGKTNLPAEISLKISLKGVNYRRDGISYGTLALASAVVDKKGAFNAKIGTANLSPAPEEYRAEIIINPAILKNKEKELKRAGFNIDELSKVKIIRPFYLAYPHMVERRLKSALAISKPLNKFIALYPEMSAYLLDTKNHSEQTLNFSQLKEIQTAINAERVFVTTAQEMQKVISQLYTASETVNLAGRNPNSPPPALTLPTADEVKEIWKDAFVPEIFAKLLQDCYYWFDAFQNVFSQEQWRGPANSTLAIPPEMNADKWKALMKKANPHLDKVTDECGQYIKADIFVDEFSAKADNIIALLNELNDFSETITSYLNDPEDGKLSGRLREKRKAIIFRFGKLAPTDSKQAAQPGK